MGEMVLQGFGVFPEDSRLPIQDYWLAFFGGQDGGGQDAGQQSATFGGSDLLPEVAIGAFQPQGSRARFERQC